MVASTLADERGKALAEGAAELMKAAERARGEQAASPVQLQAELAEGSVFVVRDGGEPPQADSRRARYSSAAAIAGGYRSRRAERSAEASSCARVEGGMEGWYRGEGAADRPPKKLSPG